jgi:hypothetical protein
MTQTFLDVVVERQWQGQRHAVLDKNDKPLRLVVPLAADYSIGEAESYALTDQIPSLAATINNWVEGHDKDYPEIAFRILGFLIGVVEKLHSNGIDPRSPGADQTIIVTYKTLRVSS